MRIEELSFDLNPENIASEPREVRLGRRDMGRMLVANRTTGELHHSSVMNLDEWLEPGDVLILNDSKRMHGVLKGYTEQGGQVEIRFTDLEDEQTGRCVINPTHFVEVGGAITLADGSVVEIKEAGIQPHNLFRISSNSSLRKTLQKHGVPITSFFYDDLWKLDNYNPVYAKAEGSMESPMAGLHFTDELLDRLSAKGVLIRTVTLHVVGSWLSLVSEITDNYAGMPEWYEIPPETADAIAVAREGNHRVVAVGSTSIRTLESAVQDENTVPNGSGVSDLYIFPGHKFRTIDAYFTNFHPSKSSLMLLDASFCPKDILLKAYKEARDNNYMFFEFGDAILYV